MPNSRQRRESIICPADEQQHQDARAHFREPGTDLLGQQRMPSISGIITSSSAAGTASGAASNDSFSQPPHSLGRCADGAHSPVGQHVVEKMRAVGGGCRPRPAPPRSRSTSAWPRLLSPALSVHEAEVGQEVERRPLTDLTLDPDAAPPISRDQLQLEIVQAPTPCRQNAALLGVAGLASDSASKTVFCFSRNADARVGDGEVQERTRSSGSYASTRRPHRRPRPISVNPSGVADEVGRSPGEAVHGRRSGRRAHRADNKISQFEPFLGRADAEGEYIASLRQSRRPKLGPLPVPVCPPRSSRSRGCR